MIPKTFEIMGRQWQVKYVSEEALCSEVPEAEKFKHHVSGWCCQENATIYICEHDLENAGYREVTFYHELEHAVLYAMGVYKDDHDEEKVDLRGQIRHQYETSKKGEVKV